MFDDFIVAGGPLVLSTPEEVDEAEVRLGIRFPTGYREYVTRFGQGVLGGSFVRIYPPKRILGGRNNVAEWRARLGAFWFWDEGRDVMSRERVMACVIVGDTLGGDELIVHPDEPERVYVLPANSERIFVAGDGLPAAIEWVCSAGTLTAPFAERRFDPF